MLITKIKVVLTNSLTVLVLRQSLTELLEDVEEALSTILKVELTLVLDVEVLNLQILKKFLLLVEGLDLGFLVLLGES